MRFGALVTGWLLLGCASAPAPTTQPARARAVPKDEPKLSAGPSSVASEIGGMSHDGVEQSLKELHPAFIQCVEQASQRLSAIGGRVSVRMRVDPQGNVRWAYLSDTTLGDREAEACVLDLVKGRRWPQPKSGDGLAETSFEVDAAVSPRELSAAKAKKLARSAGKATRSCRKGVPGKFLATVYVGRTGKVLSAGVAPPNEKAESASDCIAAALLGVRARGVVPGQNAPAKVSLVLP